MKEKESIVCNVCGRKIKMDNGILKEDIFEGRKQWGFFSNKDSVLHSFYICEPCYDKIASSFLIPPKITEMTEL